MRCFVVGFFFFMRVFQPQRWQHSICSFWFEKRLRERERLRKSLSWSQNNPKRTVETQPNIISLLINGPWMDKTLPPSWHHLLLLLLLLLLLTGKKVSFKLVSIRNMTSTLVSEADWRNHISCFCTLIKIHYNSIPYSKLLFFFNFLSNLTKKHITGTWKRGKIEMQRNLWSKSVLTKEEMQWRDRRKSFIT